MRAVYSFIAEEKADAACPRSVAGMCRTLSVSRQGFYDWETRSPSERQVTDRLLAAEIEAIWECSARTYGAPGVHAWLCRQGHRVSRKRVARIMRTHDRAGVSWRCDPGPPSSTRRPARPRTWWPATSTPRKATC